MFYLNSRQAITQLPPDAQQMVGIEKQTIMTLALEDREILDLILNEGINSEVCRAQVYEIIETFL